MLLRSLPVCLILFHLVSGWNYGGGGGYGHGWHDKIPSKIIVKHIPKHVPVYKPIPIPNPVPVPKPVGFLKPLAIAKPFKVPHVVPVIKHFQKPFPVLKGVPFHFPIPLPKLVKLPFQIKVPKPYIIRVPKPYAVAKKFPVAVPVHIPKPYVVPVYKPVPVGVPQKIPKIVNVYKEVPEYVKKPVPVYVEEQPYKPDNYKGTPYIPSGGHKGTPFPGGIGGENKGTPYISSGKGGGGGGGRYYGKGSNVHATSAASFLAAHAGKLQSHGGGYGDILGAYSQNQAYSGLQSLGGGIHGGYQTIQGFGNYHGFGNNFDFQGSYNNDGKEHGAYDIQSGYGPEPSGYDLGVYGRGANSDKAKDAESDEPQQAGYGQGEGGNQYGGEISYDTNNAYNEGGSANNQEENKGYNNPAYLGVSVTTFNDHGGRGGGYQDQPVIGGHSQQGGYENNDNGNEEHDAVNNQGYNVASDQESHNSGGYEVQRGNNYAQVPALTLYQIQNGAATAINYPNAASTYYNTGSNGYNTQQGYSNQGEAGHGYSPSQDYHTHNYGQNEQPEDNDQKPLQQSSYGYQGQPSYPAASQQNNQEYPPPQHYESAIGYGNQESSHQDDKSYGQQISAYQHQNSYNNQGNTDAYPNQASYQVNNAYNSETGYGAQNIAPGLESYGLRAAYPVQPGVESHNQLQGAAGTTYIRTYDKQGENQVAYNVHNSDNYQTQDSQQHTSYSSYTEKSTDQETKDDPGKKDEKQTSVSGRSFDGSPSESLVGSSSGYSTPEGGDTKGSSWRAVQ